MQDLKVDTELGAEGGAELKDEAFTPLHKHGHRLSWTDLSAQVTQRDGTTRSILEGVSGFISSGRLSCILGGTGSGKTTLLNVLAGRFERSKISTSGTIELDGTKIETTTITYKQKIACVDQKDSLLNTATPREAIRFAARLRLPQSVSDEEIATRTEDMLSQLGLLTVADALIGHERARGLSGGELRRVSLATELVVRPSIIFLDEVTSGLDTHSATQIMKLCQKVAANGAMILSIIHQPNSDAFGMIDDLILMKDGKCMYHGPTDDALLDYFSQRGFPLPRHLGPEQWVTEVLQSQESGYLCEMGFSQEFPNDMCVVGGSASFSTFDCSDSSSGDSNDNNNIIKRSSSKSTTSSTASGQEDLVVSTPPTKRNSMLTSFQTTTEERGISLWTECKLLFIRDLQNQWRDNYANKVRYGTLLGGGVLVSLIFAGTGNDSPTDAMTLTTRVSLVFLASFVMAEKTNLSLFDSADQEALFIREYRTGHFGLVSYGLSKLLVDCVTTLIQASLFLLICYWTVALQGRLWYWLAVNYVYGLVAVGIGALISSVAKDAINAKEYYIVCLLPQLLFSGFMMPPERLPEWLQWVPPIMPFTAAFRLILTEEFSSECLTVSPEEKHVARCLDAVRKSVEGGIGDAYNDSSEMISANAGVYSGKQAVLENLLVFSQGEDSFSTVSDSCMVQGSQFISLNEVNESMCDVTVAHVQQGPFHDDQTKWVHFIQGNRLRFDYSEDSHEKSAAIIKDQFLYYPNEFVDFIVDDTVDQASAVDDICETMEVKCPETFAYNNFQNRDDCTAVMSSLPKATINDRGVTTIDGNSTGCRNWHRTLAEINPGAHCPHLSFLPEADLDGTFMCNDGTQSNLSPDDFFSDDDFALFDQAARAFGLDTAAKFRAGLNQDELRPCSKDIMGDASNALMGAKILPDTFVCSQYLKAQYATGDNNMSYWGMLLGFFVAFRLSSLFFLRRKAT